MKSVEVKHGNHPVVLAIPHTGSYISEEILKTFLEPTKQLIDTDWNVHRLYDCHSIRSRISNLFPSRLPVFNIETNSGKKAQILKQVLARILKALVKIAGDLTAKETCQYGYFS